MLPPNYASVTVKPIYIIDVSQDNPCFKEVYSLLIFCKVSKKFLQKSPTKTMILFEIVWSVHKMIEKKILQ
jgi:hypothetical protein